MHLSTFFFNNSTKILIVFWLKGQVLLRERVHLKALLSDFPALLGRKLVAVLSKDTSGESQNIWHISLDSGSSFKDDIRNLLLTEFEVRAVSYGPSFVFFFVFLFALKP